MSALTDFLLANPVNNLTAEVTVSNRLKQFPFKIKAMTNDDFTEYQKKATKVNRHKKVEFDTKLFNELVVINQTIEPNFRDAESVTKSGCITPEQFLNKVLLAGEVAELAQRISELSGFDVDMEEVIDDAKN